MRFLTVLLPLAAATALAAGAPDATPPAPSTATSATEIAALRDRVQKLEAEVDRLRALVQRGASSGIVYGPSGPPLQPLPEFATQANVLAERGVPTRVEWDHGKRILYYGQQKWSFDDRGQLIGVTE
jgi:hypothetical protein